MKFDGLDLLALVALGLIWWGLWAIWEPLAPTVTGGLLLAMVVWLATHRKEE